MQNAFNAINSNTVKKLIELKSQSYSALGVELREINSEIKLEAIKTLETGLRIFECSGVTLFVSDSLLKKTGGLDIEYNPTQDVWVFEKNAYVPYVKEFLKPVKKSVKTEVLNDNKIPRAKSNKKKSKEE